MGNIEKGLDQIDNNMKVSIEIAVRHAGKLVQTSTNPVEAANNAMERTVQANKEEATKETHETHEKQAGGM